jgi:hypothetical protein
VLVCSPDARPGFVTEFCCCVITPFSSWLQEMQRRHCGLLLELTGPVSADSEKAKATPAGACGQTTSVMSHHHDVNWSHTNKRPAWLHKYTPLKIFRPGCNSEWLLSSYPGFHFRLFLLPPVFGETR